MSVTRPRVAVAALTALFLWPFAHYAIVTTKHMSPWKYCGFAMYCVPNLPVSIDLFVREGADWIALPGSALPRDGQQLVASYCNARRLAGTLGEPSAVAAWLFRTRPHLDALRIVVRQQALERRTGLVTEQSFEYPYERPGAQTTGPRS